MNNNNKATTLAEEQKRQEEETKKLMELYGSPKSADTQTEQSLNDLQNYYSQQSANLAQSRKQEKEDAYVLYQRMQKYMPQYLKSLGMTGLGVSETYASQAMGDYQNNLSGIEQAYRQEQQALDSEKYDRQSNILANYATAKEDERQGVWDNVLESKYGELLVEMDKEKTENGEVSQETYDKTMAWIEANKDKLPNTVYQQLMAQMQGYQPKVEEETEQSKVSNVDGGSVYNISDISYGMLINASTANIKGLIKAYDGLENIPSGTVYKSSKNGRYYVVFEDTQGRKDVYQLDNAKEK